MKVKYILTILVLYACSAGAYAQWDPQFSQYWRVKTYFNPAFAGETSDLQATILHRQQWVGISGAPKTFIIAADMPFRFFERVHGVGLSMMTESIGLFSNKSLNVQYAYKKQWGKNLLNIGVQAGLHTIGFASDKIHLTGDGETDDAQPTGGEDGKAYDFGLGVSWITPDYYAGLSVSHLTEPAVELSENSETFISRTYYLTAGYNIRFQNPLYELQPSFLIKSDAVFIQYDITARLVYAKMFNAGISWRKDDGFIFSLGLKYKSIDAGYAYDLSMSDINVASSGTHEFFVRLSMPIKLQPAGKNRQKSVRIL
ncbi:MAG: type IX secretion system membrane protein PorP/SprF [Prevotella sp.]|jgi:type IX secretion system PorP/SprF family membrane protein|nr:type IX secretion system membrane protein PorP/SprF [Prevotella sp.]